MKILFIPSQYRQIYSFIDSAIIHAIKHSKHECIVLKERPSDGSIWSAVISHKPDLILTMVDFKFPPKTLTCLKRSSIKRAIWMTEDPFYIDKTIELIQDYDYVFTIDTAARNKYKEQGHNCVFHLSLGANQNIYTPKQVPSIFLNDICLIGYPYPNRIRLINFLLRATTYQIQVVGPNWYDQVKYSRNSSQLKVQNKWIEPKAVINYYNGAKIVLNTHRTYNETSNKNRHNVVNKSINNRTFEIACCGAFQLIEFKEDLPLYFIEGEEIVSFTTPNDLLEKLHYYIQNEKERRMIARKARGRVLDEHTFYDRINTMLELIEKQF
ncbi:CgeB family protein [Bacillus solitudinis]|uniref:CgeB family protein n=1 Tax=Bacillus solitudinis TaxID=2014074 RepID=UPI000C240369|nr:glycosyltransferase [Bacillus solitudinis]